MNENNIAQYINKDALVAEIEKRWRSLANKNYKANGKYDIEISTLLSIKSFINTLEVKDVEIEKPKEDGYIDLGLPSGTLWKSTDEEGYYIFDYAVEKFGDNLPTKEQWEELKNECKWEWKGNGYDVTGPNGNMIFLHAAGGHYGSVVKYVGTRGGYWSSTYNNEKYVWSMYFDRGYIDVLFNYRDYGQKVSKSIRLVK